MSEAVTSSDVLICQGLPIALGGRCHCASQQQPQLGQEGFPEDAPFLLQPASSGNLHALPCVSSLVQHVWQSAAAVKQGVQQSESALTAEATAHCCKLPTLVQF